MKIAILGLALLAGLPAMAQTNQPVAEDFKPSTLNQPGQQYPQVNSQRYARFRIAAPNAQNVRVSLGLGGRGPGGRGGFGNNDAFEHLLIDELIPYVDANFRTLADQPHRGMAGLSMGGMETHGITLKHLDTFSHIGLFSGGVISPSDVTNTPGFKKKVKVVFCSCGSRENPGSLESNHQALGNMGIKNTVFVSQDTGHEFLTWRRSLRQFAPLLFRD